MERALKERIIGATVLVVFVVLVVPIFLDGPPADGEIVTERVLLPGQSDQETQTVVLERDRTEPVPVANSAGEAAASEPAAAAEPEQRDEAPEPVVIRQPEPSTIPPKPEPEPPAEESDPEPEPTSSTGMWAVQLGSLSNKENAERLASDLRKQGYAAFLSKLETGSGTLHRVRIGPQENRAAAEAIAARLAKADHDGQVVPHP
jgi:DedD protein